MRSQRTVIPVSRPVWKESSATAMKKRSNDCSGDAGVGFAATLALVQGPRHFPTSPTACSAGCILPPFGAFHSYLARVRADVLLASTGRWRSRGEHRDGVGLTVRIGVYCGAGSTSCLVTSRGENIGSRPCCSLDRSCSRRYWASAFSCSAGLPNAF